MTRDFRINHTAGFFPTADMRGKWHAADHASVTPICGKALVLDFSVAPIMPRANGMASDVHPFVCRRCLRLATAVGYAPRARTR